MSLIRAVFPDIPESVAGVGESVREDIAALGERGGKVELGLVDRIGKAGNKSCRAHSPTRSGAGRIHQASIHAAVNRRFMPARQLLDITSRRAFFIVVAALTLCVCAAVSASSSVLAVSLKQLSHSAELVFEGEVIDVNSSFSQDGTSIHTYVRFRVVEVVKGAYSQSEITLRFLGGTVGEISLDVSDSTLPQQGERGIYFVESLNRFQVNPFYGMDQGHFLIFEHAGQRVMATRNGRVIIGLTPAPAPMEALSTGIARGLSIATTEEPVAGLTTFQFKQAVRQYAGPPP